MTFPKEIFPRESSIPAENASMQTRPRIPDPYSYRYIVMFGFAVEVKGHKSGDPN